MDTFVSLPPFIIHVSNTTNSPTFATILNQPFITLFSSQSTDPPKSTEDTDNKEGGFGGTFEELEFDEEEETFPDHMLMTIKQLKILNKKMNSIIQSKADMGKVNLS